MSCRCNVLWTNSVVFQLRCMTYYATYPYNSIQKSPLSDNNYYLDMTQIFPCSKPQVGEY